MTFTVTGTAPALQLEPFGAKNLFFVVDIAAYAPNGGPPVSTGRVGAVLRLCPDCTPTPTDGGVPEPSAWSMLILGFGSVGAVLRNRRARLRTAFA